MPLSKEDLDVLVRKGYDIQEVTVESEEFPGLRELKNVERRCIFLKEDGESHSITFTCALYPDHPRGCKFYPLIFNQDKEKCVIDDEYCPHWEAFLDVLDEPRKCKELKEYLSKTLHLI